MTTTLNMRIDSDFKAEMEEFFEDIGLNMTTAIMCFLKKTQKLQAIPFTLGRKSKQQRLLEAYHEAKEEMNAPDAQFCDDPDKLKEFLLA